MAVRQRHRDRTSIITFRVDETIHRALDDTSWTHWFTPRNLVEARERFLATAEHRRGAEPRFVYASPPVDTIQRLLDSISDPRFFAEVPNVILAEYQSLGCEASRNLEMMLAFARDDDEAVQSSARALFGWPDEGLLSVARSLIGDTSHPIRRRAGKGRAIEASLLADSLSERLQYYGLEWEIQLVPNSVARVWVDPLGESITIDSGASFWERDIAKLRTHEIDTHVLRALNGREGWTAGIFALGFAGAEETDEGLALWNEISQGTFDHESERLIALHVLGIDFASTHSFAETFEWLREYFPGEPEFAFNRVLRWKRGFRAQDMPFSFPKDLVYFRGLEAIRSHFDSGGELRSLYFGRTSLESLQGDWTGWRASFFRGSDDFPRLPPFAHER